MLVPRYTSTVTSPCRVSDSATHPLFVRGRGPWCKSRASQARISAEYPDLFGSDETRHSGADIRNCGQMSNHICASYRATQTNICCIFLPSIVDCVPRHWLGLRQRYSAKIRCNFPRSSSLILSRLRISTWVGLDLRKFHASSIISEKAQDWWISIACGWCQRVVLVPYLIRAKSINIHCYQTEYN